METHDQGWEQALPDGVPPPPPPPPPIEVCEAPVEAPAEESGAQIEGGVVPVDAEPGAGGPPPKRRGGGAWVMLLIILLVVGAGGGAWYWHQERQRAIERQRIEEARRIEAERLARARGAVRVVSVPAGAVVTCDGRGAGVTPLTVGDLKLGRHEFRIEKPGYEPAAITAEVQEDKVTDPGVIVLNRSVGSLSLTTIPAGADFELVATQAAAHGEGQAESTAGGAAPGAVPGLGLRPAVEQSPAAMPSGPAVPVERSIGPGGTPSGPAAEGGSAEGGAQRGKTPILIEKVPTGRYGLTFRMASWTRQQEVEILRNQQLSVTQEFIFGAVVVTSDPAGAWVKQNGVPVGQTPLRLPDVEPGTVNFAVEMDGHEPAAVSGNVEAARETALHAQLRAFGEVVVVSEPAGAVVTANGQEMGVTPLAIRGTEGSVQVKLSREGYFDAEVAIEIKVGQRIERKVALEKPSGHSVGIPVPGRPGYVRSPYKPDAGVVEVRDFATGRPFVRGTEVKCPFTGRVFVVP